MDRMSVLLLAGSVGIATLNQMVSNKEVDELELLDFLLRDDDRSVGVHILEDLPHRSLLLADDEVSMRYFFAKRTFRELEYHKGGRRSQLLRVAKKGRKKR